MSMGESGTSVATALYVSGDTPSPRRRKDKDKSASTGRKLKGTVRESGKGKQRELLKTLTKTPVNAHASSSKQLADYSVYKGRGRYASDNTDGNTTINAKFSIDPLRNGGKNFQYDEVVRRRADRQCMQAGDCECCRDYYQQIGPMPPRLQAPLWRTPPSSPHESKPCLQPGSAQESADITSHKQTISRHRHHWAPASTPPSYWSIGFPNTQEVGSINKQAREMHQQKHKIVQEEANKNNGRFKKR
ncbi:DNA repair protein endonuclease SAE2/CtIP C-terminus-domain-containing protein [Mycena haematopus]|nr:DNA repair protein endonuclease SAE2/CtIP C-terminus-domain-containing protein [Mycena haematopus]